MSETPPFRVRIDTTNKTVVLIAAQPETAISPENAVKLAECLTKKAGELVPRKVLKGSRLPADWEPDAKDLAWTAKNRPDIVVHLTVDSFRDYWQGKPGKDGLKLDWSATWRNWCRNTKQGETVRPQPLPINTGADISKCVKCQGTGHWYPGGFGKGVAPCREHEFDAELVPVEPTPAMVTAIDDYRRKVAL